MHDPMPRWMRDHLNSPDLRDSIPEEGKEWIRSRPKVVQDTMRRVPPSCVVRVKSAVHVCCPVNSFGVVRSYDESGKVGFQTEPEGPIHKIHPDDLVVDTCLG